MFGPKKSITFWNIADGAAEYPIYGPPGGSNLGQITATRLLPHGHAFFLTPSFLIAEPDKAHRVIRWFVKDKSKNSTPGTWKLVCAHDIRQYLLDIAIEKSAEKDALENQYQGDPRKDAIIEEKGLGYSTCKIRFQLYELVDELLSQRIRENSPDYDSDELNSPIVYASEFVDVDNEQALVTWFAGWAMCRLDQFRKFTVVGSSTKYEKRAVRRKEIVVPIALSAEKMRPLAIAAKLNSSAPTTALSGSKPQETRPLDIQPLPPISESSTTNKLLSKPRHQQVESVGALGSHCVIRPPALMEIVGAPDGHAVTIPQQTSPRSPRAGSDAEISIGSAPSESATSTKHGIDHQVSQDTLRFIAVTSSNLEAAKYFLARADYNLQAAIKLYGAQSGPLTQLDSVDDEMDIDEHVSRAVELYGTAPTIERESFSPQFPQFDGPGDKRPRSSGANSNASSRSGIQTDENGHRTVPSSVRPNSTVRPELAIKPGYIPSEDREVYRNRQRRVIDG